MKKYSVGQKVFLAGRLRYVESQEVTITKIGRKWAYISYRNYRFDLESGRVDGGDYSSPGDIYMSRSDYEEEVIIEKMWHSLRRKMEYTSPCATADEIVQAAKILHLSLEAG